MQKIYSDQRWYHLATILSTPFSLPLILIGNQLSKQYGVGTAVASILIGNLILWLIGLTVISMAPKGSNAIGNIRTYLGRSGGALMWLIMLVAILNWFTYQLREVVPILGHFIHLDSPKALLTLGICISLITTALSMRGIQLIKWIILVSFFPIFFYYIFALAHPNPVDAKPESLTLSLPAILSTILILLPGMINLPTLYRHSKSKADSFLGLSLLMLLISFFEISTIWAQPTLSGSSLFSIFSFIFILLTLIYINLINLYYASALWETYIPRFEGSLGFLIFGLLGTAYYAFIPTFDPTHFLADITNCFLASLGVVLLIAKLVESIVRHRPRKNEVLLNLFCWLTGCITATIFILQDVNNVTRSLILGAAASIASFLLILFIEENIWSIKKVFTTRA